MKYGNAMWRFLFGETRVWKTWKTIKLGTGLKAADDFCGALRVSGFEVNDWARDIFGKSVFIVSSEEKEISLVVMSNADLGQPRGCSFSKTVKLALATGLKRCPAEVGPQLRQQYPDQPYDERLLIAMEPIVDSGDRGDSRMFCVGYGDGWVHASKGRWLSGMISHSDFHWGGTELFVFCK